MKKFVFGIALAILIGSTTEVMSQQAAPKFGKGFRIAGADSTFYMKIGLRFQTLFNNGWNVDGDDLSNINSHESAIFIRRSRLKFDGWAVSPKLKYKLELALSNRDNGGGNSSQFSNAANIILDAKVEWNFAKNLNLAFGQMKMPGNRERLISSGDLQLVDRSRLNSRYTTDRDVGFMLKHKWKPSGDFVLQETLAFASGEGKNITSGNIGGYSYTAKIEAFPFGKFENKKAAYVGSSVNQESKPKLAIAAAYELNERAGRERGQKGNFIVDNDGSFAGKDLHTLFADLMFKYKRWSLMAEYAMRRTADNNALVFSSDDIGSPIATYYTGSGANVVLGYMVSDTWEIAGRWTGINPDDVVANNETQYTFGVSKYVVGHKLKVQTDLTYRAIDNANDDLIYRLQMDIHF